MAKREKTDPPAYLSKREQQIMEIAYAQGRVTAPELEASLPGNPANSSVRTFLRILEKKGHLRHIEEEGRYVYLPVRERQSAARSALAKVVDTFFGGSISGVLATLLTEREAELSEEELREMRAMIDRARAEETGA